jgi:hypothetical protein
MEGRVYRLRPEKLPNPNPIALERTIDWMRYQADSMALEASG